MSASAARVARKHLTQQKTARYLVMVPRADSFGLSGPGAEEAGVVLAETVKAGMDETKNDARHIWKRIAAELLKFDDLDQDPRRSRVGVSDGLHNLYMNLAVEVMDYFDKL